MRVFKAPDHKRAQRAAQRHRDFPHNTCPASRHVQMIGETLARGETYHMIEEEPEHVAGSLLWTVAALYKARKDIARLRTRLPPHGRRVRR